jgi:UPF0042 nucleotide-binding protein
MITITSYGAGHPAGAPENQHHILDVQKVFKDPDMDPRLRYLDATHPDVIASVLRQPGALETLEALADLAQALSINIEDVCLAVCCRGGRHRAPALADAVARELEARGVAVTVVHRDMELDVIEH